MKPPTAFCAGELQNSPIVLRSYAQGSTLRRRRGAHLPRVLLHSIKLSPVLRLLKQILRSLQITLLLCGKLSRLVYLLLVLTHLLLHSLQRSLGLVSSLSLYLTHLGCLGQLPRCLRKLSLKSS